MLVSFNRLSAIRLKYRKGIDTVSSRVWDQLNSITEVQGKCGVFAAVLNCIHDKVRIVDYTPDR